VADLGPSPSQLAIRLTAKLLTSRITVEAKMTQVAESESPAHRLVRRMIALKMTVGKVFVSQDGDQVINVNGYTLKLEQLFELDRQHELTNWGIKEFAEK
jgi:hypothetical protein